MDMCILGPPRVSYKATEWDGPLEETTGAYAPEKKNIYDMWSDHSREQAPCDETENRGPVSQQIWHDPRQQIFSSE